MKIDNSLIKQNNEAADMQTSEDAYQVVRGYVIDAQSQIYRAVNSAMVTAYWEIGKKLYEVCGENDRAAYGKQILQYISKRMTEEFGNGFSVRNLQMMRKFYITFSKTNTLCSQLSWSHYRLLMNMSDEEARNFYSNEAVKSGWSVRQLVLFFAQIKAILLLSIHCQRIIRRFMRLSIYHICLQRKNSKRNLTLMSLSK